MQGNDKILPELLFRIPNVNYTRLQMARDGILSVKYGGDDGLSNIAANSFIGSLSGNATSADKVNHTISLKNIDNNTVTFNGQSDIDITSGVYYAKNSDNILPSLVMKPDDLNLLEGTKAIHGWCSSLKYEDTGFDKLLTSDYKDTDFCGIQIGMAEQRIQMISAGTGTGGSAIDVRVNDFGSDETGWKTGWYGWQRLAFLADVTAANTGGIVAQSLGANGYVKFANGLILQWRNSITIQTAYSGIYQSDTTRLPIDMSNAIALLPFIMTDSGSFPNIHGYVGSNNFILQSSSIITEVLVFVIGY